MLHLSTKGDMLKVLLFSYQVNGGGNLMYKLISVECMANEC